MSQRKDLDLASIKAVAERKDVSQKTLRRYIASGRLTGYRFGPKLIRVDLDEVDALLQRIPAASPGDDAA